MPFFRNSIVLGFPYYLAKEIEFFIANLTGTIFSISRVVVFSVPIGALIGIISWYGFNYINEIYEEKKLSKKRRYLR
jgi:hypothetical protein